MESVLVTNRRTLAMLPTVVSGFLLAMFLTSGTAQEQLRVNESEWDQLSDRDRDTIKKILQDSRLVPNVNIVPSATAAADLPQSPLRDVPPGSADWFGGVIKI